MTYFKCGFLRDQLGTHVQVVEVWWLLEKESFEVNLATLTKQKMFAFKRKNVLLGTIHLSLEYKSVACLHGKYI